MSCIICEKEPKNKLFVVKEKSFCGSCLCAIRHLAEELPLNVWEKVKVIEELSKSEGICPEARENYKQTIYGIKKLLEETK